MLAAASWCTQSKSEMAIGHSLSGAQGVGLHVCAQTARRHPPCKLRLEGLARTLEPARCAAYMRASATESSSRDAVATLHLIHTLQHVVDVAGPVGRATGHPPFLSSRVSRKHQSLLAPYLDVTVLILNSMSQPTQIQGTQRFLRGATEILRVQAVGCIGISRAATLPVVRMLLSKGVGVVFSSWTCLIIRVHSRMHYLDGTASVSPAAS